MKKTKSFLSLLLSLLMIVSVMPAAVLTASAAAPVITSQTSGILYLSDDTVDRYHDGASYWLKDKYNRYMTSLTVNATGSGLSYQWEYTTTFSDTWITLPSTHLGFEGVTKNTVDIYQFKSCDQIYRYRCKITGAGGTVYSKPVTLIYPECTAVIVDNEVHELKYYRLYPPEHFSDVTIKDDVVTLNMSNYNGGTLGFCSPKGITVNVKGNNYIEADSYNPLTGTNACIYSLNGSLSFVLNDKTDYLSLSMGYDFYNKCAVDMTSNTSFCGFSGSGSVKVNLYDGYENASVNVVRGYTSLNGSVDFTATVTAAGTANLNLVNGITLYSGSVHARWYVYLSTSSALSTTPVLFKDKVIYNSGFGGGVHIKADFKQNGSTKYRLPLSREENVSKGTGVSFSDMSTYYVVGGSAPYYTVCTPITAEQIMADFNKANARPQAGKTFVSTYKGDHYTAKLSWYMGTSSMTESSVAYAGNTYYCNLVVMPDDRYYVPASMNSAEFSSYQKDGISKIQVLSHPDNEGVLQYDLRQIQMTFAPAASFAVTKQPLSQGSKVGETVKFSVTASGTCDKRWQYSYDGGKTWTDCEDGLNLSGSATDTLSVKVAAGNFGNYLWRCRLYSGSSVVFSDSAKIILFSGFGEISAVSEGSSAINLFISVPDGTYTYKGEYSTVASPDVWKAFNSSFRFTKVTDGIVVSCPLADKPSGIRITVTGSDAEYSTGTTLSYSVPEKSNAADLGGEFLMYVEDLFTVSGRGTALTGRVTAGELALGGSIDVITADGTKVSAKAESIEMFGKTMDSASAGDNAGIMIGNIDKTKFARGNAIVLPGSKLKFNKTVSGTFKTYTPADGGRSQPISNGYRPQAFIGGGDQTAMISNIRGYYMLPGDTQTGVTLTLMNGAVMYTGQQIPIREGGRTVGEFTVDNVQNEPNGYVKVAFDYQGGTGGSGIKIKFLPSYLLLKSGEKYGTLPSPVKSGYVLKGFYTKASGGTLVTENSLVPSSDVTLYAQWQKNEITSADVSGFKIPADRTMVSDLYDMLYVPGGAHYSIKSFSMQGNAPGWGGNVYENEYFDGEAEYSLGITLAPESGWAFTDSPAITVNGGTEYAGSNSRKNTDGTFTLYIKDFSPYYPQPIKLAEVAGFMEDGYAGLTVGDIVSDVKVPAGNHFSLESVECSYRSQTGGGIANMKDVIESNAEYSFGFRLVPDEGYYFVSSPDVYINADYQIVDFDYSRLSGTAYTIWTVDMTFPEPVVKTPVIKTGLAATTEFSEGSKQLNLSVAVDGILVTNHWERQVNGEWKTVPESEIKLISSTVSGTYVYSYLKAANGEKLRFVSANKAGSASTETSLVMTKHPHSSPADLNGSFLMYVEDVFLITGRGTVLTGRVTAGKVSTGDKLLVFKNDGSSVPITVLGIEMFRKIIDYAETGDNVGLLVNADKSSFAKGYAVVNSGGMLRFNTSVEGTFTSYTKEEGGRSTPIQNGYKPQALIGGFDHTAIVSGIDGCYMMPGDTQTGITLTFTDGAVMYYGQEIIIREGGRVIGSFTVTNVKNAAPSVMLGDVDGNGQIEAADARLALRAAVGLTDEGYDFKNTSSREFIAADAEKNGVIEAADARLILRASVGLETL